MLKEAVSGSLTQPQLTKVVRFSVGMTGVNAVNFYEIVVDI